MKRKIMITLALLFLLTLHLSTTYAGKKKSSKPHTAQKPHYDLVVPLPRNGYRLYYRVKLKGKWGVIDPQSNAELIPPKYDEIADVFFERTANPKPSIYQLISSYSEDMAAVKVDGKWGFVDKAENQVVEPKYQMVRLFKDGMAAVQNNGQWGFIDRSGREKVSSRYDLVRDFVEGMAVISVNSKENPAKSLYGFIDKTGMEIVPPKYDKVQDFNNEGTARVSIASNNTAKPFLIGFIDKTGREIIPLRYPSLGEMHDGMVLTCVDAKNEAGVLFGFINRHGELVVPPAYSSVENFHEGRAAVRRVSILKNGKYTFIDQTGRELFPPRYDDVRPFSEGLAAVMKRGAYDKRKHSFRNKWGFIDKTGREVIPLKYLTVSSFKDGRAQVQGAPHFIDKRGKKAVPPKTQQPQENRNAGTEYLIRVKLNGKWGYADFTGEEVVPVKYDELPPTLSGGLNRMKENGKYGYLDMRGNEVIPAKYDELPPSLNAKFNRIKRNGKYGYLDARGNEVTPAKYDSAPERLQKQYSDDLPLVRVAAGGKFGYLSRETGEEIVPVKYDYAPEYLVGEKRKVKRDGKWGYLDTQGRETGAFQYEEDPCAFGKKKGDHFVFLEQSVMRSKPDPGSDVVTLFAPGTTITVGSKTETDLTRGDDTDQWYKAASGGERGYVWGGDIADSAFTVRADGNKLLFLIRNRTNGTNQCYKPKFEMKMLRDGKVLSEYSGHPFDQNTTSVRSVEYVSMDGFSAPLKLLKVRFELIGYKDTYARFGTAVTYFYIDDGKLNKVLDILEEVGGEEKFKDHKFLTEVELPDNRMRVDKIVYTIYSSMPSQPKKLFARVTYQWDWDAKTFKEVK